MFWISFLWLYIGSNVYTIYLQEEEVEMEETTVVEEVAEEVASWEEEEAVEVVVVVGELPEMVAEATVT